MAQTLRWALFVGTAAAAASDNRPPHIFFILVDDLGYADVGFNREAANPEIVSPSLDELVASGIHLTRHYVHPMCTPTRTSVQSGRLPVHVNTLLGDPCHDNTGIPRNMTGLAEHLQRAGYSTHFAGKWDAGMATPKHTPNGRGYDTSLHYFSHKNDFWSQVNMQTCCQNDKSIIDFWRTDRGASDANGTGYSEFLFQRELVGIVEKHDPQQPMLLFYAPHVAHCPLQVPKEYFDKFSFMENDEDKCRVQTVKGIHSIDPKHPDLPYKCRQIYHAMVMVMDEVVGNVTNALKSKGMWDNTLVIMSSDNGGPINMMENAASNWPLRGGKYSKFEGGIRVAAFVSGGYIPVRLRGTSNDGMVHIADWYATLCGLAGVDPTDHLAASSGLPPIDSLDVWPFLVGATSASPRDTVPVTAGCLVQGDWKLIVEQSLPDFWQGPVYPNSSSSDRSSDHCADGCLFNVVEDRTEQTNLFAKQPARVATMKAELKRLKAGFFQNRDRFQHDCPEGTENCACWMATNRYAGFMGPYAMTGVRANAEAASDAAPVYDSLLL